MKPNRCKAEAGGVMQESKNVSREVAKARRNVEELASIVVDCAFNLHSDLGPEINVADNTSVW
jgi:hypothetical protein